MTRYLISISVGPVQEFIAAARKTADLYAGSRLLLDIVGAAAGAFTAQERIFPADVKSGGANKILAEVEGDPQNYVNDAKKRAYDQLIAAWDGHMGPLLGHLETTRAEQQLASVLEFYAAWVEVGSDYQTARRKVESLLAARKALRDFSPLDQGDSGVPKSPLDPAYACVFTGGRVPEALQKAPWNFKPSEVLDAVSLLKREYGRAKSGRDVHILDTHVLAQRAADPAAQQRSEETTPANGYFAILVADGDNMGAMLSANESPAAHRQLSSDLDQFAAQAKNIVERCGGMTAFAGGDDVLALLPVTTALQCGQELAAAFREKVGGTLSAGLAIVHYKEPLSTSLAQARIAEKAAKKVAGKDALCVALHTRGGAPQSVSLKWADVPDLQALIDADLPRSLPYELRELAAEWPAGFKPELLHAEAQRIVGRKVKQDGHQAEVTLPPFEQVADLTALSEQMILARFLSGKGERA